MGNVLVGGEVFDEEKDEVAEGKWSKGGRQKIPVARFPFEFNGEHLQRLLLQQNKLETLPPNIGKLTRLHT